jgi:2-(1,2-epoxy-1,2-dihydrophenyl)acetyl-CoA isomerase
VLLASDGPGFCTGGNVHAFAAAEDRREFVHTMARELHEFVRALVEAPVPVVAGVHGWAAGAGMSIACAADIVVGGPGTRFRPAYPSIGFSPDGGMSWTLPRTIGAARARDLILTDGVLTGEEAYRAGLLSRLVPDADVRAEAERVAATLAQGPTSSLGRAKRLLWESAHHTLAEHLDAEADAIAACADSPAGREGVDAFTARREPRWPAR